MKRAVSRALFSALLLALLPAALAGSRDTRLTGFDALTAPGGGTPLRAKLEYAAWPHGDIRGERIEFLLADRPLGSAVTDSDGVAALPYTPKAAGEFAISVRLGAGSKLIASPASLLLAVWEPTARILVTDLDHTLADVTAWQFLTRDNKAIPPLPGAADALRSLAKSCRIIYLTARDEAFTAKTRTWLADNHFPLGPVFCWGFGGAPLSHETFKRKTLAELKKTFLNIVAGVGDLPADARAYLSNGMQAFILAGKGRAEDDGDSLPAAATPVKSWDDIVQRLTAAAKP